MYGTTRHSARHYLPRDPVVFTPPADDSSIRRAVEVLGLKRITIQGVTVSADEPPARPAPTEAEMESEYRRFMAERFNSRAEASAAWQRLFEQEPCDAAARSDYWQRPDVAETFEDILRYLELS